MTDIKFVKHVYGKEKRQQSFVVYDPRPTEFASTSAHDIEALGKNLMDTGRDIALLHVLPLPVDQLPSRTHSELSLPSVPPLIREKLVNELSSQPQPINHDYIAEVAMKFLSSLKYTPDQVKQVEVATSGQRLCKRWQEERMYRITASKLGRVIKHQRNHTTLAKQLLYMNTSGGVSALVWGQQHEVDAIAAYSTSLGPNFKVRDAGVYIDACGFFGSFPRWNRRG